LTIEQILCGSIYLLNCVRKSKEKHVFCLVDVLLRVVGVCAASAARKKPRSAASQGIAHAEWPVARTEQGGKHVGAHVLQPAQLCVWP